MRRQTSCENEPPSHDVGYHCDQVGDASATLHKAITSKLTQSVSQCSLQLQDQKLIAKFSADDLVAQQAKYHSACLGKLYNNSSRTIEEEKARILMDLLVVQSW